MPSQRAGSGSQRALDPHMGDPLLVNGARAHLIHERTASASQTGSKGCGETVPSDRFRGHKEMQLAVPNRASQTGPWVAGKCGGHLVDKSGCINPDKN